MAKCKTRNLTFGVSIKTFWRKWEGETLPKWFFIYKQLSKCQNEYYFKNLGLTSISKWGVFPCTCWCTPFIH